VTARARPSRVPAKTGTTADDMTVDAYETLRQEILSGKLLPNERLIEADLVARLGARRSGVRAALTRLAHEGLVEHERNRGAKVRRVGELEAIEIVETRAVLEGLLARKAAAHATPSDVRHLHEAIARMRALLDRGDLLGSSQQNVELHERILQIADHGTAARVVSTLNSQVVRFQYRTMLQPGRPESSYAEHVAIVDAIAKGDGDAAEAAMRRHLSAVAETLHAAAVQSASGHDTLAATH
jgi:DNA-binding GntR family transcriptional regulator